MLDLGTTDGCAACEVFSKTMTHSKACRERFRKLLKIDKTTTAENVATTVVENVPANFLEGAPEETEVDEIAPEDSAIDSDAELQFEEEEFENEANVVGEDFENV